MEFTISCCFWEGSHSGCIIIYLVNWHPDCILWQRCPSWMGIFRVSFGLIAWRHRILASFYEDSLRSCLPETLFRCVCVYSSLRMEAVTIKALELWSYHGKKIKVKVLKILEKFKSPQFFYFKLDVGILHSIVGQSHVSGYSPVQLSRMSMFIANWVMIQVCQDILICFFQPMLNFKEAWKELWFKLKLCLTCLFKIKSTIKPIACELFTTRATKWWHFPENSRKTYFNLCSAYIHEELKLKGNYAGKYQNIK